ncbi:MAG: hypothetical protein FWD24_05130 [Treponema sp.]|nr:hypothetical protein [Treponema sp.]
MHTVLVKKKVYKIIEKAPLTVQILFDELVKDLQDKGPIQNKWPNYSKLSENRFHCHLNYSYVVCWYNENDSIQIEVYYAGTREKAPY